MAILAQMAPGQAAVRPPSPAADSAEPIFSSEARYVPLNVTVTDKTDHLVTNLPQSAFQVYENNVLQPIKVFKHEDVPVSMGLVIDNSGSMRSKRAGCGGRGARAGEGFQSAGRELLS